MSLNKEFDFYKYRYFALAISALYIVISIIFMISRDVNWGIDFKGGIVFEVRAYSVDISDIRSALTDLGYAGANIQTIGGLGSKDDFLIKLMSKEGAANLEEIELLKTSLGELLSSDIEFRRVDYVGPQIGVSLVKKGMISVLISLIGILSYVAIRFNINMGVSSVLGLLHDFVAVFCFYVISGIEFNVSSIAVLLIILGYSINDSVVVFDRIRENLRKYSVDNYPKIINTSLNQTLGRTIITSFTTLVVTISIAIFGGETLRGFSLALCFGIIVGTYSTIFIAAPFSGVFFLASNKNITKSKTKANSVGTMTLIATICCGCAVMAAHGYFDLLIVGL